MKGFSAKSGTVKRNAALTLVQNTIQATNAVTGKDILDPAKFHDRLGKVIDGVAQWLEFVGVVEDEKQLIMVFLGCGYHPARRIAISANSCGIGIDWYKCAPAS